MAATLDGPDRRASEPDEDRRGRPAGTSFTVGQEPLRLRHLHVDSKPVTDADVAVYAAARPRRQGRGPVPGALESLDDRAGVRRPEHVRATRTPPRASTSPQPAARPAGRVAHGRDGQARRQAHSAVRSRASSLKPPTQNNSRGRREGPGHPHADRGRRRRRHQRDRHPRAARRHARRRLRRRPRQEAGGPAVRDPGALPEPRLRPGGRRRGAGQARARTTPTSSTWRSRTTTTRARASARRCSTTACAPSPGCS